MNDQQHNVLEKEIGPGDKGDRTGQEDRRGSRHLAPVSSLRA